MPDKVGFVGLGTMGGPMCLNLVMKGFETTVYDVVDGAADPHLEAGARQGQGLGDVARNSDVVFTMLPNSPDVEKVILGEDGILANGREGMLLIDTSTIFPGTSIEVAKALSERGIGFVDAAVGRTPMHAAEGKLMFMVGGSETDVARARPILEAMGDTIHHCGSVGAGVQTKLINNFLTMAQSALTSEALTLAQKVGLDPEQTIGIMSDTMASNALMKFYFRAKVLGGDFDPGFAIRLARKDLDLALQSGEHYDVAMTTGAAALSAFDAAIDAGNGDRDFSYLLVEACEAAGVETPRMDPLKE